MLLLFSLCSFLSCFAAGVFLGTCLLDLYPEVQSELTSAIAQYISTDSKFFCYPFGEAVMVAGFFLVLIIEQMVMAFKENSEQTLNNLNNSHHGSNGFKRDTYGSMENTHDEPKETDRLLEDDALPLNQPDGRAGRPATLENNQISSNADNQHEHNFNSHSPIRSLIMLAALSLHSVFEGLAVGLQRTEEGVLSIFGALILHKCIIAFSIGLNLVQSKLAVKATIFSNAIFCFASPLGIAIGILITD